MKRMLINAAQQDELRVAIVKDTTLYDLDIERTRTTRKKANIYKGKITRIEPSLGAAFVYYGPDRHGFLPFKEITRSYFPKPKTDQEKKTPPAPLTIADALHEGQEIMVQVAKEERGNKGAALTTFVSLAGSYLVLMPNNPRAGGISRRVEGKERTELKAILSQLHTPEDMGVIIRTAGVGKSIEELQWDLDALLHHWETIQQASKERPAPFLIHQEGDVIIRALRDHMRQDTAEIIVDREEAHSKIIEYLKQIRPDFCERVNFYQDKTPLFSHYQIEQQIETAYQRKVVLPSGGSIVIDLTEALVSIDVNSAKATGGRNIEETALNTNLEAAEEIARQLRLRDIGGLIVIDFIDMVSTYNQREVANRLREATRADRARVHIGNITRFGLMEMSRQRIRSFLGEEMLVTCPRCEGQGAVRSTGSLALSILRLLEEDAAKDKIVQLQAHLPIEMATYLLNEKREAINAIEQRQQVKILVIPNQYMKAPKYKIKKLKPNELPRGQRNVPSYKLIEVPKQETISMGEETAPQKKIEEPAVKSMLPKKPSPVRKKPGVLKKLLRAVFGSKPKKAPVKSSPPSKSGSSRQPQRNQRSSSSRPYYNKRPTNRYNSNRSQPNRTTSKDKTDKR